MVRLVSGSWEEEEEDVEIRCEGMEQLSVGPCHPLCRDLLRLPEEIILNIMSRLPVELVLDCRLVSKTWRNLPLFRHINNFFADMHLCRLLQIKNSKLLGFMFLDWSHEFLYYVEYDENDVQSYHTYKRIKVPLPDADAYIPLVGSCNGLICLPLNDRECSTSFDHPFYICNPITREFVRLPGNIIGDHNKHMKKYITIAQGFGYHPCTKEYKVVRVIYYCFKQQPIIGHVQVYTLGSGIGWRNKQEINHTFHPHMSSYAVSLDGALHWISSEANIVAFDLADEEFRCLPTPLGFSRFWQYRSKLWVLAGRLCIVHQATTYKVDIWLLKKKKNEEKKKGTSSSDYDDGKQEEQEYYKSWSWSREFTIPHYRSEDFYSMHQPFAITKRGELLLWNKQKTIFCYDPKSTTAELKKLVDLHEAMDCMQAVSHFNSLVSLKALGEDAEIL